MSDLSARRGRSVRGRLLAIALMPMMVVLPAVLGLALFWWWSQFDALLVSKANDDLIIARQYLHRIMERSGERLQSLSRSSDFERAVRGPGAEGLQDFLDRQRAELGLDFLYLAGPDGHVVTASPGEGSLRESGGRRGPEAALRGESTTFIDVFGPDELGRLSPALVERSRIPLVPTEAAAETDRTVETRGLVVHSATPAPTPSGGAGALVGGSLLNGNLGFVDTINELIYAGGEPSAGGQGHGQGHGQGTATLFIDDVRIATNVRLFGDQRALGTRASRAVRDAVLGQGRIWLDSAFVVNDWYVSAYEPILDSRGARVGMLYVGFLERPFQTARLSMLAAVVAAFAIAAAVTVPILLRWAQAIFRPLERMNGTITAVERGDFGAVGADDEIARLARHFDGLLDRLQERDRQLRAWAQELDSRVEERTRQLEDTRRQLVMSEKLASIGEITAGVAHEINNPIAVIQGNLEVARDVLGRAADEVRTEFELIDQQVHRINMIVTRLLQFARPEEYAGYVEPVAPGTVLADSLVLVRHLLARADITIDLDDRARRMVEVSRTELQQVAINLIVNAIHAMPAGGTLALRTRDLEADLEGNPVRDGRPGVAIAFEDSGVGIPADQLKKIFNPFFTTRGQDGTGLGLSISYTLMARYGGSIEVTSEVGVGSTFTVHLPAAGEEASEPGGFAGG